MPKILCSCLLSAALLLTACGGGSSSGGGDSNSASAPSDTAETSTTDATPGSDPAPTGDNDIAGTYVGTGTATASGGGLSETVAGPVQITISENGSIAFGEPGSPPVGTGTLNTSGNTFALAVPASFFNEPGLECTGTLNVDGNVNGNTITGNLTGSGVVCVGIPITVTGDFSLQKTGAGAQARASGGLMTLLGSAIPDIVR